MQYYPSVVASTNQPANEPGTDKSIAEPGAVSPRTVSVEHGSDEFAYPCGQGTTRFHGEMKGERAMGLAENGFTVGKAAPYGSMHYENGHWVIGDVVVDDLLTKMMGGMGTRVSGILLIEFKVIPTEVTSTDTGLGGPFEASEPA